MNSASLPPRPSAPVPPAFRPAASTGSGTRITDPLSLLLPGAGTGAAPVNRPRSEPSSGNPPLTGELVARAMREALSQLPPDQRNAQINAFRNLAMSLNQNQSQSTPVQAPISTPTPVAPTQRPADILGALASGVTPPAQYQEQIAQMRDLGITDENLSLMALRESNGDVAQAVELIFSGYFENA